jgi:hypothetical protein
MILYLLQDKIRLKMEYDLNSNVSLAGMPKGSAVQVVLTREFVPYWIAVCLPYIYI